MKNHSDIERFNDAMDTILRADPKAVKGALEADMQAHAAEREAKGERKRGRKKSAKKRPSVSSRAASAKN